MAKETLTTVSIRFPSKLIENLKEIARLEAFKTNSDVLYTDLIRQTVLEKYPLKEFNKVIFNGKQHNLPIRMKEINYEQIVCFAYPSSPPVCPKDFTIAYHKGHILHPEGIVICGGENVPIVDGMIFDVART